MRIFQSILIVILILLSNISELYAKDKTQNEIQSRYSFELYHKLSKDFKLGIKPEIRFDDKFSTNKYLIDGKLDYKPLKLLTFSAIYRFEINTRNNKPTQYLNRYGFSSTIKKKIEQFVPSLRLYYSNYADDEIDDENFIRYKGTLKYDIRKSKITPSAALELFQQLGTDDGLYKVRYSAGIGYKLMKRNYIKLSYKLDYYRFEYLNVHIISLGYKLKL